MSVVVSAGIGFAVAGMATLLLTPLAIRLAIRTNFLDRPRQYRQHAAPTPFLGGAGVLLAYLIAAFTVGAVSRYWPVILGAVLLCALGTLDDRIAVAPKWRLLAESGIAILLYAQGFGWSLEHSPTLEVLLTIIWIAGIVNAFNLMDNQDGACATTSAVCCSGIGLLAAIHGQSTLAGLAFALGGASIGFLRWNLSRPARVFLGDGGSMLIGFLVATMSMAAARHLSGGDVELLAAALLVGVPILDTALVSFSRIRRRVTLVTGGRDHLTHRLLLSLGSARVVALTLAVVQAALCALALIGDQLGSAALAALALSAAFWGLITIIVLDGPRWRPVGIADASQRLTAGSRAASSVRADSG